MPSMEFLYEKEIVCNDTGEVCKGYNSYLKSAHWIKMRKDKIKWHDGKAKCAVCGKESSNVQLHHISYKHLGNERPSDLVVLCAECHEKVHENKDFINFMKKHRALYSGQETMAQHKKSQAKKKKKAAKHRKMYRYATCPNSCHVRKVC